MKVFISQEMRNLSNSTIKQNRIDAENHVMAMFPGRHVEFIDSILKDDPMVLNAPVDCLGRSIRMLADADLLAIVGDISKTRGCRIERTVAEEYGIPIMYVG